MLKIEYPKEILPVYGTYDSLNEFPLDVTVPKNYDVELNVVHSTNPRLVDVSQEELDEWLDTMCDQRVSYINHLNTYQDLGILLSCGNRDCDRKDRVCYYSIAKRSYRCRNCMEKNVEYLLPAYTRFCNECKKANTSGEWWIYEDTDTDYCENCREGRVDENFLKFTTLSIKNNEYGSLLDWIPIYSDVDHSYVTINVNRDSPYYGKAGVAIQDDHGRMGYFNMDTTVSELLKNFQGENLTEFLNAKNFPIYYG